MFQNPENFSISSQHLPFIWKNFKKFQNMHFTLQNCTKMKFFMFKCKFRAERSLFENIIENLNETYSKEHKSNFFEKKIIFLLYSSKTSKNTILAAKWLRIEVFQKTSSFHEISSWCDLALKGILWKSMLHDSRAEKRKFAILMKVWNISQSTISQCGFKITFYNNFDSEDVLLKKVECSTSQQSP